MTLLNQQARDCSVYGGCLHVVLIVPNTMDILAADFSTVSKHKRSRQQHYVDPYGYGGVSPSTEALMYSKTHRKDSGTDKTAELYCTTLFAT